MKVLKTKIEKSDKDYQKRFKYMKDLLSDLNGKKQNLEDSYQKKDSLSVRQRVEKLIDPDSFFLELSPLAGLDLYKENALGAGLITGVGSVCGNQCMIIASNPNSKGGAYFPISVKKHLRAQKIALENKLTCIYLVDSAGAYLPLQSEVFPDENHFGRIFYNQALMSQKGISQISAVLGSCTAGGAYIPAMSDENVIVRNKGSVFLGGPPLVEIATGQKISKQDLGGAEVHSKMSGLTDHIAETEEEALEILRSIVSRLNLKKEKKFQKEVKKPLYDPEELYGIMPLSLKESFDMREVISRIVDGSEFDEFKKNYGRSLVSGFSYLFGFPVGILANNGVLMSESALKASHFIQICDQRNIPLIFLQNVTGFMVGQKYEKEGIAKHGAKMVTSLSQAKVPKFTVIIGNSFGAGNYGMCGRAFNPNWLWLWPSAKTAVMGGLQASSVLSKIKEDQFLRNKKEVDKKLIEKIKTETMEKYEKESHAYYSTARLWDDGIIDPIDTRKFLSLGIQMSEMSPKKSSFGPFRM